MLIFRALSIALLCVSCCAPALGFESNGRWESTATNSSTGGNGTPITLTWSIVPDGAIVPGRGPSDLVSWLDGEFGAGPGGVNLGNRPWFPFIAEAFDRWDQLTGANLVHEPLDDGVALGNFAGELDLRGDVRLGGAFIDGPGGTLAYSGLVGEADIVIDTSDAVGLLAPADNYRKFRNTLMHEIGHSLGLVHITSGDAALLLEPSLDLSIDGPQLDDIRGVQRLYGDAHEFPTRNNALGTATPLGELSSGETLAVGSDAGLSQLVYPTSADFVSISGSGDQDWYSFVIDEPTAVDVALTPRGGSFMQTPQGGELEFVDATAANNLGFGLHGPDEFNLRGSSLAAPAGSIESIVGLTLPEPAPISCRSSVSPTLCSSTSYPSTAQQRSRATSTATGGRYGRLQRMARRSRCRVYNRRLQPVARQLWRHVRFAGGAGDAPQGTSVPEPAAGGMIALAVLATLLGA